MSAEHLKEIEANEAAVNKENATAKAKAQAAKRAATVKMAALSKVLNDVVVENVRAQQVEAEKKKQADALKQRETARITTIEKKMKNIAGMFRAHNR